jgi:hypothetical protein
VALLKLLSSKQLVAVPLVLAFSIVPFLVLLSGVALTGSGTPKGDLDYVVEVLMRILFKPLLYRCFITSRVFVKLSG